MLRHCLHMLRRWPRLREPTLSTRLLDGSTLLGTRPNNMVHVFRGKRNQRSSPEPGSQSCEGTLPKDQLDDLFCLRVFLADRISHRGRSDLLPDASSVQTFPTGCFPFHKSRTEVCMASGDRDQRVSDRDSCVPLRGQSSNEQQPHRRSSYFLLNHGIWHCCCPLYPGLHQSSQDLWPEHRHEQLRLDRSLGLLLGSNNSSNLGILDLPKDPRSQLVFLGPRTSRFKQQHDGHQRRALSDPCHPGSFWSSSRR